ncbi:hypothetical protein LTR94_031073, partial [Friedmanniomyces endolithicus]
RGRGARSARLRSRLHRPLRRGGGRLLVRGPGRRSFDQGVAGLCGRPAGRLGQRPAVVCGRGGRGRRFRPRMARPLRRRPRHGGGRDRRRRRRARTAGLCLQPTERLGPRPIDRPPGAGPAVRAGSEPRPRPGDLQGGGARPAGRHRHARASGRHQAGDGQGDAEGRRRRRPAGGAEMALARGCDRAGRDPHPGRTVSVAGPLSR